MIKELHNEILEMLRPLRNRAMNSIARATVNLVNNAAGMQLIQVEINEGELADDVEHWQPSGFVSVPRADSEAIVFFVGGDRNQPIAMVSDRTVRPTGWSEGEAGIYSIGGAEVRCMDDGTTEVSGGGSAELLALKSDVTSLKAIFDAWVTAPNDGGASLKTVLDDWSPAGTTKLKGE